MCIFFIKSLYCGCQIIACQTRQEKGCIIITNHSYKWICDKCINSSDEVLDDRLNKMKKNDTKIYFGNGWSRSPSSPTDYYVNAEMKAFENS